MTMTTTTTTKQARNTQASIGGGWISKYLYFTYGAVKRMFLWGSFYAPYKNVHSFIYSCFYRGLFTDTMHGLYTYRSDTGEDKERTETKSAEGSDGVFDGNSTHVNCLYICLRLQSALCFSDDHALF